MKTIFDNKYKYTYYSCHRIASIRQKVLTTILAVVGVVLLSFIWRMPIKNNPATQTYSAKLQSLKAGKKGYEVFGFAPYWTMNNMQNVDFSVLTTFSYFGIPVDGNGNLTTSDPGYSSFESQQATDLFTRAHQSGTRVVLTLTQMDPDTITAFLDNPQAQQNAINQSVAMVQQRGIDGINVDFEYITDPGQAYRDKFSAFVTNLNTAMHQANPASKVTVSVIASAVKDPKLYDLHALSQNSDGIFMMAYDFANTLSNIAMPTDPLYGYKNGTYWYDVSTAVQDFLTQMPANKLILGVPWYSYNYGVYQPTVKSDVTYWSSAFVQTYATASADTTNASGWDPNGEVGWKAYYDTASQMWRMVFVDDSRALGMKYDFAKDNHLAGVGMWALGFDNGTNDMWNVLRDKFGTKVADNSVLDKAIQN